MKTSKTRRKCKPGTGSNRSNDDADGWSRALAAIGVGALIAIGGVLLGLIVLATLDGNFTGVAALGTPLAKVVQALRPGKAGAPFVASFTAAVTVRARMSTVRPKPPRRRTVRRRRRR